MDSFKVRFMNKQHGFTLIELIVTMAIAAIVLTIGVPSFQSMMRNNRAATQANEFMSALNLARSEAVKRGQQVSLCPSTNQATCTGGTDWQAGWIVFVDTSGEVLRVGQALSGTPTFTGPSRIHYLPTGYTSAPGQFDYSLGTVTQRVCVYLIGRSHVEKDAVSCP